MAGRTLLLLSGNSPQRLLGHLPSGYSTAVSYGQRKVTLLGDNAARISYQDDLMPPLHNEGVLLGLPRGECQDPLGALSAPGPARLRLHAVLGIIA